MGLACCSIGVALVSTSLFVASQTAVFAGGVVTVPDEAALRTALAGGGQVTLTFDGTIVLTNTISISVSTEIDATRHSVTLSGGNQWRIFEVSPGVALSIRKLTFNGGQVQGTNGAAQMDGGEAIGGAILVSNGILNLTDCRFLTNSALGGMGGPGFPNANGGAARGGAIYLSGGALNATNAEFAGNTARGGAGGVVDFYPGATGFGGIGQGGSVYFTNASVHLEQCRFLDNRAEGGLAPISLQGNGATSGSAEGGALWNQAGTAFLVNCEFRQNSVTSPIPGSVSSGTGGSACGGAVFNSGAMNVAQSTWFENRALGGAGRRHIGKGGQGRGGALFNSGTLTLALCVLESNAANGGDNGNPAGNGAGGAVFNSGDLRVQTTSFMGNSAIAGKGYPGGNNPVVPGAGLGGAVSSEGSAAVNGCTFAQNRTEGAPAGMSIWPYPGSHAFGGAFFNSGQGALTNNTFSLNTAQGGGWPQEWPLPGLSVAGGNAFGGALFSTNGSAFLVNNTLAYNRSCGGTANPDGIGFGDNIAVTNSTVKAINTLLACHEGQTNAYGTIDDLGHNLSSDNSCGLVGTGSLNNADPKLGPLAFYGGPTETLPLLAGSPALDAGSNSGHPLFDQRGRTRPFGSTSDIGAFESSPPYVVRGLISGRTLKDEVAVVAGFSSAQSTNGGLYSLDSLGSGLYSVTPQSADYLFVPASREVTVGPDQLNVDFKAYHWNALSLDDITNQTMHMVFAGTNGNTVRLLNSADLVNWIPVQTNVVGTESLLHFFVPVGLEAKQFFRTAIP